MEQRDKWIFAYLHADEYVPENLYASQDEAMQGLEYADVANNSYQLWHYPSGDIFSVRSDRELDAQNYQTSHSREGVAWLPILVKIGNDVEKVTKAYQTLQVK